MNEAPNPQGKDIRLTVVYDNVEYGERLRTAWGFSCLVEGLDSMILFDTGGDGRLLLSNMAELDLDPGEVDIVFLSHAHGDHIGGLSTLLEANHDVTVCLLRSFPASVKEFVQTAGAKLLEVQSAVQLCPYAWSTGQLGGTIPEQSLIVDTKQGLLLITGCAHPGIVSIAHHARRAHGLPVHMALGGFHLNGADADAIRQCITGLKKEGVHSVAPSHCTGEIACRLFQESYANHYYEAGVGWQHILEKRQ